MNFIRYHKKSGRITSAGFMEPSYVQAEIDDGLPTMFVQTEIDPMKWSVNLSTKELQEVAVPYDFMAEADFPEPK